MTSSLLKNFLTVVFFVCFHFIMGFMFDKFLPWNQFIDVMTIYFYVIMFIVSVFLADYIVEKVKKEK